MEFVFNESEWNTPNTYNTNYRYVPKTSGIYLLVHTSFNKKYSYEILYVGSAKNLNQRYSRHEVIRLLREFYDNIMFYFREELEYREEEKKLIKTIQPKFNKQWR